MGTASFFSAMTMDMNWNGTGSTSEVPPSSLPDLKTVLGGDEVELEPWDIIMQEIRDMGMELDFELSISPSNIIHAAGESEYGAPPPPHHGVPAVSDQPETSPNTEGGYSCDAKVDG
jgi:hypothetical protein